MRSHCLLLPALTLVVALPRPVAAVMPPAGPAGRAAAAATGAAIASVRDLEYRVSDAGGGRFVAPNRSQDLRASFDGDGVVVRTRTGDADWTWSWKTAAWGRDGALRPAGDGLRTGEGNRVEFRFGDGLVEWWVNRPDGLEQGFTVPERPAGAGLLVVRGRGPASLDAADLGDRIEFRTPGASPDSPPLLVYDRLQAFDAAGRELPGTLSWEEGDIVLRVDDAGAAYPVDIDPYLTRNVHDAFGDSKLQARLGVSVHTAGDVNADGFSDIILGAPDWDNGALASAGSAFLYRGAGIGIEANFVWQAQSIVALAKLGSAVSTAGDVNGDGYDDVIVGAPDFNNGGGEEGRAYLYLGTTGGSGYLQGSPAWSTTGSFANSNYGFSVAGAGDVNGDGYDDVLVGAPYFEGVSLPTNAGAFYLYHGSAGGPSVVPDFSAFGVAGSEYRGYSVAPAGDVNADGYADVIVGAPRARNSSNRVAGKAFLYYGSASGLQATPTELVGNQEPAWFGASVHLAGDVNGDGYGDVIVGQPLYDGTAGVDCGRAAMYAGGASGLGTAVVWAAEGTLAAAEYGTSVASAGDVDANSYADVVVGAPKYAGGENGFASVHFGRSGAWPSTIVTPLATGDAVGDHLGSSVCTAGDLNGDGFSDVILVVPDHDQVMADEGMVQIWMGSASEVVSVLCDGLDGTAGGQIGKAVCLADVDGDGWDEWLTNVGDGRIDVHAGDEDFVVPGVILQTILGPAGIGWGSTMTNAGDIDGDGYDDVAVGSPLWGPNDEGAFDVYYGSPTGLQTPAGTHVEHPDGVLTQFGFSLASAGDYDNDGHADLMVGGPRWGSDQGTVRVYRGSSTGLVTNAFKLYQGSQAGMQLGYAVSSAGDYNDDGFSDYVIGAPFYDFNGIESSLVAVYLGGDPLVTFLGSKTGIQNQAGFGKALTFTPDMDGNGHSEFVVGAPNYDFLSPIFADTGALFSYDGADTSLPPTAIVSFEAGAMFGAALANAGDTNADGLSDLAVGIPGYNNTAQGETGNGRVVVYQGRDGSWWTDPAILVDIGISSGDSLGWKLCNGGDRNGDGFADFGIATPYSDDTLPVVPDVGTVIIAGGSGDCAVRFSYKLRALAPDGGPVAWWGNARSADVFRAAMNARSAGGRLPMRLELQLSEISQSLGGGVAFGYQDPGGALPVESDGILIDESISALSPDESYMWRARVTTPSPYFPGSIWLTPAPGIPGHKSFRADDGTSTAIPEIAAAGRSVGLRLESVGPNPTRARTSLRFSVERREHVRAEVVDVTGRRVAVLADGIFEGGSHAVTWAGVDSDGRRAASGVYYLRVAAGDVAEARAVTLLR
jgi:hypothetical protein